MKKIVSKAAAIVFITVLVLSLVSCGKSGEKTKEQYPELTQKFFVNDYAGIMTEEDVEAICNKGAMLQEKTTAQVVVVTVEGLDGKDAFEYSLGLSRAWEIGSEEDNGVVVFFSESDREIRVQVGYGLEGALPDHKIGRIIDTYGASYFEDGNFSSGLASIYDSIINEVYYEYNMEVPENYTPIYPSTEYQADETSATEIIVSWIVLIILIALYIAIFGRRGGLFIFGAPRFFGGFHHHGGFGGFHGGGFGGFRGGGSGGFGGFRGGGGGFGGGGAGRKF